MTLVVAHITVLGRCAAGIALQQVQWRWPAEQFHGARAESAADPQAESFGVERFGRCNIGNVEVDDEGHGDGVHGDFRHVVGRGCDV
ncbi:hypothetical protein D3C72_2326310 [compost metagenome]